MTRWNLSHCALSVSIVAVLAGCGGSQPPIGAPGTMLQTPALAARGTSTNYKVLYSFGAPPDGNYPTATLIDVGGTLYGTTAGGGTDKEGTVFSITPGGAEKVLYSFSAAPDGNNPHASLLDVGGLLYGTTRKGGQYDECGYTGYYFSCGTVFSITTGGAEKVLHSFGDFLGTIADGTEPDAALIKMKGTLYGTTAFGGSGLGAAGTVFSIMPNGTEKVLHTFGHTNDGDEPEAPLIKVNGTFYGTTEYGGANREGTVFSITPSGTEKVLHSFDDTDGNGPVAALVNVKGTLYGTTAFGGTSDCNDNTNCGTVFSITLSGTEKVLHHFRGGTDGSGPTASLINVNGTLYGTTAYGGPYSCSGAGCGTVFSITPSGREKVLHSFRSGTDGFDPSAALINVGGTLYGTTEAGGAYGYGTVFALTP